MPLETLARPRYAAMLLLCLAGLQAFYNGLVPLHPDEAYYWVWSRRLALSYFDHPPMIAWLLAGVTLAGVSEFTLRLVPVVSMALAAWFTSRLANAVYGERAGALALILFLCLPVTQLGAMLVTPDAPLLLFWSLALYASERAVFAGGARWFALAGVAIGCALLSKYTAILFPGALLLFLLARRHEVLLHWPAWMAMLLAVLVFAPVLVWNQQHDWISFAFQYAHGTASEPALHANTWFEFIAGIALSFSPVLLGLALVASFSRQTRLDDRRLFLAALFLVPLAFFLYKGLFKKMELNWVAIAYPAATALVAGWIAERRAWRTLGTGLAIAVLLSLVVKFPVALGLPERWSIQQRLAGFREASLALLAARKPGEALYAEHLTTASLLTFYDPAHADVRIPTPSRFSQYDLWDLAGTPHRQDGVYLAKSDRTADLNKMFTHVDLLSIMHVPGHPRTFYLYRCHAQ